jgi:hypothetical protein
MLDVRMASNISYNLVAPRPKDQARYTIRELLILGLTLPVRFCPLNKFGPEALGLEIVSLERINEALWNFEREQWRMWQSAQFETTKNLQSAAKASIASDTAPQQKVLSFRTVAEVNWGRGGRLKVRRRRSMRKMLKRMWFVPYLTSASVYNVRWKIMKPEKDARLDPSQPAWRL